MMNSNQREAMVSDLQRVDRYTPQPDLVELVQTHASWVFLAGDHVYKVKKPVNFGFLDFSTLAKRRFCCEEELRLNRRLGGDYYLKLEEIVSRDGGYFYGGPGTVVDYAVVMRRLPESFLMRNLLAQGELKNEHLAALANLLQSFYEQAQVFKDGRFGTRERVRFDVEENFSQTEVFINDTILARDFKRIVDFSRSFLEQRHKLFVQRVRGGFIREGHGDLHMEHICMPPGQLPVVYDCIEFNQRFRRLDVVNDIAFLAMDLEVNNRFDYAAIFLACCREKLGSLFEPELLFFYKCYRAYVRGKVWSFISSDLNLDESAREQARVRAGRYFKLATIYAAPPPAGITLMAGVSGSGKSFLARTFEDLWGVKVLRSDVVRKELLGLAGESAAAPFGEGIYARKITIKTYVEMARQAAEIISRDEAVVIDASNLKLADRQLFYDVAQVSGVGVRLVVCRAPRPVLEDNLRKRALAGHDASDADIEISRRQRFQAPSCDELEMVKWIDIDTRMDLLEQLYSLVTHPSGDVKSAGRADSPV